MGYAKLLQPFYFMSISNSMLIPGLIGSLVSTLYLIIEMIPYGLGRKFWILGDNSKFSYTNKITITLFVYDIF